MTKDAKHSTNTGEHLSDDERRIFSRVIFDGQVTLSQGNLSCEGTLIDMSLKGMLVDCPSDCAFNADKLVHAAITLSEDACISMDTHLRHTVQGESGQNRCGFECMRISLDSISTLRRLVEVNLGNSKALERELAALGELF